MTAHRADDNNETPVFGYNNDEQVYPLVGVRPDDDKRDGRFSCAGGTWLEMRKERAFVFFSFFTEI